MAGGRWVAKANANGVAREEASRAAYDDLDDYHGLNEAPTGIGGAVGGYAGFNVQVTVGQPASPWQGIDPRDLRQVQVSVTSPMQETISLQAYRVNF